MMSLARRQEAFLAAVLGDDAASAGWTERQRAGLAIYRNNYRSALIEALRATYERTERLVGAESFHRAAAHHCIAHPSNTWTLDLAGGGFPETCAELFANDPDVAELAWLEWTMHRAFTARNDEPLSPEHFAAATAGFDDQDWARMRPVVRPGFAIREVRFDLLALWRSLSSDNGEPIVAELDTSQFCVVWREGERPVFMLVPAAEGQALQAIVDGASFGDVCAITVQALGLEAGTSEAGTMLGGWITQGFLSRIE